MLGTPTRRFIGYPTGSVLAVLPDAESAAATAATLRAAGMADRDIAHRGHFINHYGRFATEEVERWRGPEPNVPGLLRR